MMGDQKYNINLTPYQIAETSQLPKQAPTWSKGHWGATKYELAETSQELM